MPGSQRRATPVAPLVGAAVAPDLHVMSFNAGLDVHAQPGTPDHWPSRTSAIAAMLKAERPTVLGTQELLNHQLSAIAEALPVSYDVLGGGRTDGLTDGEYLAIFYDLNRLIPVHCKQFWLSDTPSVPGSCTWGNRQPRPVVAARLRDRVTGHEFIVANTQLDDESDWSRLRSMRQLVGLVQTGAESLPVILTGDFNAAAGDSPEYAHLVAQGPYRDSWTAARARLTPEFGTFPQFGPAQVQAPRPDWLLVTEEFDVRAAAINAFTLDGVWPSDHMPVQARVRLR